MTSNASSGILDYVFDPQEYWLEKSSSLCTDAEFAFRDWKICKRNKGSQKCTSFMKDYYELAAECKKAEIRWHLEVEKEVLKNRN
jgi:hypothetical protein